MKESDVAFYFQSYENQEIQPGLVAIVWLNIYYVCLCTCVAGTFQQVEYVFLVGVGGGVPHFTDWNQHVRLGDVVVSHVGPDRK